MEVLRERFVGTIQGYYYGKPKPADQIAGYIYAMECRRINMLESAQIRT